MRKCAALRIVSTAFAVVAAGVPRSPAAANGELARPFIPSISMDHDGRTDPSEYARREGVGGSLLRERLGASGIVRCGGAIGTAQLTLRADVVTTAAHVLIGPDGKARGGTCTFEPSIGGSAGPIAIDSRSIRAGSAKPLSEPAARDWAVARLVAPVAGATPYGLAAPHVPGAVTMYAGGHGRADGMAVERCRARHFIGASPQGIREIAIDCSAAPGASGAALLDSSHHVFAIYVGYRSANPDQAQAFSTTHYNFAISLDGPFRRALLSAAGTRR